MWTGTYGFVTLTAYGQSYGPDGLNEEGLYVGVYYLPGFAEYATYDSADAENSMSVGDLMQWMLSSFKTVDELLAELQSVKVVEVKNEDFGGADLPFHFKVADPSGTSKIIEIVNKGEIKVYEPYLGVITNSPTYDWHITNQRNYLRLSNLPNAPQNFSGYELKPLGGGSGLLGMPGDFTPPSRFTRAAAFTASCRPLENSLDAVFESFGMLIILTSLLERRSPPNTFLKTYPGHAGHHLFRPSKPRVLLPHHVESADTKDRSGCDRLCHGGRTDSG